MPRKQRFHIPGVPVHVVQRGNNRQPIFFAEHDYRLYLERLHDSTQRYGCLIHAYVLMTNHVHFLITPEEKNSVSRMMQHLGSRYVAYVNRKYNRTGTLWEGRYKDHLVSQDAYFLVCMRYIEMNPLRARLVQDPMLYPWSSHPANASEKKDEIVTAHDCYLALGRDNASVLAAYRDLFQNLKKDKRFDETQPALQTGTPLGNNSFRKQVEGILGCKIGYTTRGRPKKGVRALSF